MPIKPLALYTNFHNANNFSLAVKQNRSQTKIIMTLTQGQSINTRELPQTYQLLKTHLPSILKSTCYNENNYSFAKEVLRTEIGHLFEHILIEYMCILKVAMGYDDVEYSGVTKWNWVLHPKGTFHITISAGYEEVQIFSQAMQKSIELINTVLYSGLDPQVPTMQDQLSHSLQATSQTQSDFERPIAN